MAQVLLNDSGECLSLLLTCQGKHVVVQLVDDHVVPGVKPGAPTTMFSPSLVGKRSRAVRE
jgi:hypothetical protein